MYLFINVLTMTSRKGQNRAVFEGLLDYYDEKEHFYQDKVEMFEKMEEEDALYTLQKIPDELVLECFDYVSKKVQVKFSGPQYVFRTMMQERVDQMVKGRLSNAPYFYTELAGLLRELPFPVLLKFVEQGTPSKCMLTIYPVKYQTMTTNIHNDIMNYCDDETDGINKDALVNLILEMLGWAKDYSTKKGFQAYIQKFGFWRCYHMNSSFLTKNQNRMAAWVAYCRASKPIFRSIFRRLVLSIIYVHGKFCSH
uniref:Uncharacterized protein n=1 Tax=viral metagenome TaxID=1070528 RepID=A0A6C0JJQ1_9ZZZZ